MKPYNSEPHVPTWISALDGELLSSAELDVLDFIHWCKKHDCRTSNDHIGSYTHHTHAMVQRAIQKLYRLDLIAIDNFGKRTRVLKPVPWPDRETWDLYQKMQAESKTDPAHLAPHISLSSGLTSSILAGREGSDSPTTGEIFLPGGSRPQPPACGSGGGGSSETSTPKPQPKSKTTSKHKKPLSLYQMKALQHRDKIELTWKSRELANKLALVKYPNADFEE